MSSCLSGFSKNNQTGVDVCFAFFVFNKAPCPSTSRSVSLTHVALSSSSWPPRVTYSPTSNILKLPQGSFRHFTPDPSCSLITVFIIAEKNIISFPFYQNNIFSLCLLIVLLCLSLSVSLCLCLFSGKSFFAGKVAEEKNVVFLFLGLKETMLELIFQKKKKMELMSYSQRSPDKILLCYQVFSFGCF